MELPTNIWICQECRTLHLDKAMACSHCNSNKMVCYRKRKFESPLREIRRGKGLTQGDLCALVGIAQPNLCRIENGISSPRPSTVAKLAAALNIPAEELGFKLTRKD